MTDDGKQVLVNKAQQAIDEADLMELKLAKHKMENIGTVMKGLNKVGSQIDSGIQTLPDYQQKWLSKNITNVLFKILKSNISTMEQKKEFKSSSNFLYKALVGASGAGSGLIGSFNFIGISVFVSELYLSTRIMMRSITEIARSEGEDIYTLDTQLACLQVLALGGNSEEDDSTETAYYSTRFAMATAMRGANLYLAKHGLSGLGKIMMSNANPVLKMIGLIATRLTIQFSEKFISRAVPIAGAIGGGTLNYIYLEHFQNMAKSHFVIRRLERKYGKSLIKSAYNEIEA